MPIVHVGDDQEIWKPIERWPGYEISNMGRVRRADSGRIRKSWSNPKGYRYVTRSSTGPSRHMAIHQLVADAFLPKPPSLKILEPNHIDLDKSNNRASNLEWLSHSENLKHDFSKGHRCMRGERHSQSILTEANVLEIRRRRSEFGETHISLANEFGVSKETVSSIIHRRSWRHI